MNRRGIFGATLAAGAGLLALGGSRARADAPEGSPKVVYHLSDSDKVSFVLANIRNHFVGMGGPGKVRIAIVVHGPPLMAFRASDATEPVKASVAHLKDAGLDLYSCINTMKAMTLTLDQLLPGFVVADKGGVVKLAELQGQGWLYLRP